MRTKKQKYVNRIGQSVIFWSIALSLHTLIRYYGVYEEPGVHTNFDFNFSILNYIKYGLITGVIFGVFYGIIAITIEKNISHKFSVGFTIIFESILYTLFFALAWSISLRLWDIENGTIYYSKSFWWIKSKFYVSSVIYAAYVSIGLSFIRIALEKFGTGVFFKILLGKYRSPKEETRIFMFLDLKSSTTIAEHLGHYKYSRLIQDCFNDLNAVVPKYKAEIYQYVGDEAVLYWTYEEGINENNCISLFFNFLDVLEEKRTYYEENYGQIPEFKAGLHGGKLIVAEVGIIKKEIAYHGDTINTAARVQALCNDFGQKMMISETLKKEMQLELTYKTENLGRILLKGKKEEIVIFGIDQHL